MMLDRYLWRHNSVLQFIYELCVAGNDGNEVFCDLDQSVPGISTIPTDIVITSQRPDLVIVDREEKSVTLFELSIAFEANTDSTHDYKLKRYSHLVADIENVGFKVFYYAFEVGSRGHISSENVNRLKSFVKKHAPQCRMKSVKDTISKIALLSSFIIFHSKFEEQWIRPKLITL